MTLSDAGLGFRIAVGPLKLRQEGLLQRLFSTFAKGWPGIGLLCLRLGAGMTLFRDGFAGLAQSPHQQILRSLMEAAAGLLLWAGLWTPVARTAAAMIGLWSVYARFGDPWNQVLLALLGAGMAMLGPWSIDARIFGRKRIKIFGLAGLSSYTSKE